MTEQSGEAILAALDAEQRVVAEAISGPVVVLAGAGTGKTRAITHRIAYGCVVGAHDPRRTLALTFTNRAAGQMRAKLTELGHGNVQVRTFHSAALRQLRHFWPRVVQGPLPKIASQTAGLFDQAIARANLSFSGQQARDLHEGIEALRMRRRTASNVTENDISRGQWDVDLVDVQAVWREYDAVKVASGVIDFTDVLAATAGMFTAYPEILAEVQRTYRWFTVDEYQDVSPLQWDLLRLWRGDRTDICVVGDANQTIYTFAGASPRFLLDFAVEFPEAQRVQLHRCYRCTPQIVETANAVIRGTSTFIELASQRDAGAPPTIDEYADDRSEADGVADRIAAQIAGGVDPREIAVLFRLNSQSAAVELALSDRGVPVVLRGGERFFARPEVKEAVLRMRAGARSATGLLVDEVRGVLAAMGWTDTPPETAQRHRWESLSTLEALAVDVQEQFAETGARASLTSFVTHLDARAAAEHAPAPFGVTLCTLHAAKGLEWSQVYMIGCSEGLLPLDVAADQLEEERRLCYVGMSRARDRLTMSWSRARAPGAAPHRQRSRFVSGEYVGSQVSESTDVGPTPKVKPRERRGPASCRICGRSLATAQERTVLRCVHCPGSADPQVIGQIQVWRDTVAVERDVPSYQVLTDQAVVALAELRPTSVAGILEVPGTRWLGPDAARLLVLLGGGDEPGNPLEEH